MNLQVSILKLTFKRNMNNCWQKNFFQMYLYVQLKIIEYDTVRSLETGLRMWLLQSLPRYQKNKTVSIFYSIKSLMRLILGKLRMRRCQLPAYWTQLVSSVLVLFYSTLTEIFIFSRSAGFRPSFGRICGPWRSLDFGRRGGPLCSKSHPCPNDARQSGRSP